MYSHTQKLLGCALAVLVAVLPTATTLAADIDPAGEQRTFIISAYYSPLPDQSVYFRGDYDADRRLNGNGTHAADGTPVYPGMLAAPRSYTFGTKLEIPGLGVGTIHDRGGAIVEAGVRTNAHDRIDVWMGHGEEGLARALQWGMRTVTATVYPAGTQLADTFTMPTDLAALDRLKKAPFPVNLSLGSTGDSVRALQAELKTLGYYRGAEDGTFDEEVEEAVIQYQVARRVITSLDNPGAGVFGPNTRVAMNKEVENRGQARPVSSTLLASSVLQSVQTNNTTTTTASSRFPVTLSVGDTGDRVREMQTALARLGRYDCEINGIFDQRTESCVLKFQEAKDVVKEGEFGAGVFGPSTSAKLASVLSALETELNTSIAEAMPGSTLSPSDSSEAVATLQRGLRTLGYYQGKISNEYNDTTQAAITEFQVGAGVLASSTDFGAGWFGAKTKNAFEAALREELLETAQIAKNPSWDRPEAVAYTPAFDQQLAPGDSGEVVAELQKTLAKLKHYEGEITNTYDDATRAAVISFQLENAVIGTSSDFGAGHLGPKTRAALNANISREQVALTRVESAS